MLKDLGLDKCLMADGEFGLLFLSSMVSWISITIIPRVWFCLAKELKAF